MKENIYIIIILALLTFSCEKENKIEFADLGTEMHISSNGMTSLDVQAVISVENPLKNLTTIEIVHQGIIDPDAEDDDPPIAPPSVNIGEITLSDGTGTITFTDAQLGISITDWTADLMFNSVFEGKDINRLYHLTVDSPFSIEDPGLTYRNDTTYHFVYAVEPVAASVTSVTVETKTGEQGTYVENVDKTYGAQDSLVIEPVNHGSPGDTLFVKVTATTGVKTDSVIAKLVIAALSFNDVDEFKLDSTANLAYDFILAREVDAAIAGDSADIELTSNLVTGGFNLGFIAQNNAEFIPVTSALYAEGDSLYAETADFSSPVTTVTSVSGGETYIYRTRRGVEAYEYGYLKVTLVDKPQGVLDDSYIMFEHKH